jgi:hypothetical protein
MSATGRYSRGLGRPIFSTMKVSPKPQGISDEKGHYDQSN